MTAENKASGPGPPRTLTEVHEALVRIRPARQASLTEWLSYYQRSAGWYAEVAEIDRGHHHEALSMAEHERERAKEIEDEIAMLRSSGIGLGEEVNGGEHCETGSAEDVDAGS